MEGDSPCRRKWSTTLPKYAPVGYFTFDAHGVTDTNDSPYGSVHAGGSPPLANTAIRFMAPFQLTFGITGLNGEFG